MRVAGGLLDPDDLVVHLCVAARQEGAAVDHHVDLVGAERDRLPGLLELDGQRRLAGRECRRDGRDLDGCPTEAGDGGLTRFGYTQTAATGGIEASLGSGRNAFDASAATLPGVSAPSSVVRSMQRIASSSA